jgi:ribosome-associated protein
VLPHSELQVAYARSGGPGGQRVNKVETKVVLRFSVAQSRALDAAQRAGLLGRLAGRLTSTGELVVHASRFRERGRNEADARARLAAILRAALIPPKARRPTRPTRASKARRVAQKRLRSRAKHERRWQGEET